MKVNDRFRARYTNIKPLKSALITAVVYFIVFSLIDFIIYDRFLILNYLVGAVMFFIVYFILITVLHKIAKKAK
ncbi:MAG: hypothetical protein PHE43_02060 [Candidatus Nanoarchaeia archaeon]|nr:hypothetical protein [Candidatus Nanoarchaeia archaeon]